MILSNHAYTVEKTFLASEKAYVDSPFPIHLRWQGIVTHLPEMAHKRLFDDLNSVFLKALNGRPDEVWAGYELFVLRSHFAWTLKQNGLLPTHAANAIYEDGIYMQRRLYDRWSKQRHARVKGKRIVKGKYDVPAPTWVN
jgi:hypothetical protein